MAFKDRDVEAGYMDDRKKSRFDWMTTIKTWSIQAKLQRKFVSFGLVFFMLFLGTFFTATFNNIYFCTYISAVFICEFNMLKAMFHGIKIIREDIIESKRIFNAIISDFFHFNFFLVCAMLGASGANWLVCYSVVFIVFYILFFLVDEHAAYSKEHKCRFIFVIMFFAVGALFCSFAASYSSFTVKILLCLAFYATVLFPSAIVGFAILFIFRIRF